MEHKDQSPGKSQLNLVQYRDLLESRRRFLVEIERSLERRALEELSAQSEGEISSVRLHNADMATNHADQEILLRIAEGEIGEIQAIERALERIRAGTYGACTECGTKIGQNRLRVVPETELCLDCQKQKEADQAIRRRPHEPDDPEVSNFELVT